MTCLETFQRKPAHLFWQGQNICIQINTSLPEPMRYRLSPRFLKDMTKTSLGSPLLNQSKGQKHWIKGHSILTTPTQQWIISASQVTNKISLLPHATSMPGEQPEELSYVLYATWCYGPLDPVSHIPGLAMHQSYFYELAYTGLKQDVHWWNSSTTSDRCTAMSFGDQTSFGQPKCKAKETGLLLTNLRLLK